MLRIDVASRDGLQVVVKRLDLGRRELMIANNAGLPVAVVSRWSILNQLNRDAGANSGSLEPNLEVLCLVLTGLNEK